MDRVRDQFVASAEMAARAGFDMLELHCAHGYLLSSFITPLTNRRTDEYGGSLENRMRYPLEVFRAVRAVWPADKPISVRISANDWVGDRGIEPRDAVEIARMLQEAGVDICDVSAGQTSIGARPVYGRMFQTPFSDRIRNETGMATMAVGNIFEPDHVNSILMAGRADLVCLARPHLADPYWTLHAAAGSATAARPGRRPITPAAISFIGLPARDRTWRRSRHHGGRKHALVTGGGTGIGAAIAGARPSGAAHHLRAAGTRCGGGRPFMPHGRRTPMRPRRLYERGSSAAFRHRHRQCRRAGAPPRRPPWPTWQHARRQPDRRLPAVQPALAGMRAASWRIVFIASTAGLKGYPYVAAYVAAKHGVVGLMRALALEPRRRRTVNAVCPGYTDTDLEERSTASWTRPAARPRPALAQQSARPLHPAERLPRAVLCRQPASPARRSRCREASMVSAAAARAAKATARRGCGCGSGSCAPAG